jgi:hypothetical protein
LTGCICCGRAGEWSWRPCKNCSLCVCVRAFAHLCVCVHALSLSLALADSRSHSRSRSCSVAVSRYLSLSLSLSLCLSLSRFFFSLPPRARPLARMALMPSTLLLPDVAEPRPFQTAARGTTNSHSVTQSPLIHSLKTQNTEQYFRRLHSTQPNLHRHSERPFQAPSVRACATRV